MMINISFTEQELQTLHNFLKRVPFQGLAEAHNGLHLSGRLASALQAAKRQEDPPSAPGPSEEPVEAPVEADPPENSGD